MKYSCCIKIITLREIQDPKGRYVKAQGIALGTIRHIHQALKGRNVKNVLDIMKVQELPHVANRYV